MNLKRAYRQILLDMPVVIASVIAAIFVAAIYAKYRGV